ncbi:MAG: putative alpha/beta superfamily hydrolase [Polaribacter sp.]|jgi:predicted alpha/beta superfamily hydrolase
MKNIYLIIICSFFILFSCKKEELEIIGITEEFTIKSMIINDDYPIFVFLPSNYNPNEPNQLIIGLDGEFRFDDIANIISEKSQNGSIPPCIFVAVGNSEERNRDYTPTKYEYGEGGAENYYHFLKNELIPELESKYSIDTLNTKTLIGNSFGGLFTNYAMFQNRIDNPFNKFISVGCSFWFDSGVIFEYEENYSLNHSDLNAKYYSGMGTLEGGINLGSFNEMNDRLKNRHYSHLLMQTEFLEKHGHTGAATIGFKNGLNYVFTN